MGKIPGFYFYPGDWMKDPELRSVSSEARGLWIDMLCLMFESKRRGYLELRYGGVTAECLARMTGNLEAKVIQWLEELEVKGVFSRDERGVIFCRKMVKDQGVRDKTGERVKNYRERYKSVTSPFPVRERVKEGFAVDVELRESADLSEKVLEIGKEHPALAHINGKGFSRIQEEAICEAIIRDGDDVVLMGTKNLRDAVALWPAHEKRFIPNPVKFYQESEYLKDPAVWDKRPKSESIMEDFKKRHGI